MIYFARSNGLTAIWLAFGLVFFVNSHAKSADVIATLVRSGDWTDDNRWDTSLYPDNGNGGRAYDVVINAGTVSIPALTDVVIEGLSLNGGTLDGDPTVQTIASGSVIGDGFILVPLVVDSVMAAAAGQVALAPGNSPGTLTFSHDQANAVTLALHEQPVESLVATFEFEINDASGTAGVDPGWDLVDVPNGGLTFDTTLGNDFVVKIVSLAPDNNVGIAAHFDPNQSYSWPFIDTALGFFGADTGEIDFLIDASQFAAINGVPAGNFSIEQDTPTSLAVAYVPTPGDTNGDGLADAADLAVLLANWGQDVSLVQGNLDGLGTVDATDLDILFTNWTVPVADGDPLASVPEPSSLALLLMGLTVTIAFGRVRRLRFTQYSP